MSQWRLAAKWDYALEPFTSGQGPEGTEKRLKLTLTSTEVPPEELLSIVPYSWNALSTLKISIMTPKMSTLCHNMGYEFISVQ
jgi:hypothetical protein